MAIQPSKRCYECRGFSAPRSMVQSMVEDFSVLINAVKRLPRIQKAQVAACKTPRCSLLSSRFRNNEDRHQNSQEDDPRLCRDPHHQSLYSRGQAPPPFGMSWNVIISSFIWTSYYPSSLISNLQANNLGSDLTLKIDDLQGRRECFEKFYLGC